MKELESNTVESSEMVEETFKFWFNDNEHIRSPFPKYIHTQLKEESTQKFFEWATSLNPKAKDEMNDEMIGEKFEEFIFETATTLIKTDDERITVMYPFLPRLGDKLQKEGDTDSVVIDRALLKEGDHSYLKINLENLETKEKWDTKFDLPV